MAPSTSVALAPSTSRGGLLPAVAALFARLKSQPAAGESHDPDQAYWTSVARGL